MEAKYSINLPVNDSDVTLAKDSTYTMDNFDVNGADNRPANENIRESAGPFERMILGQYATLIKKDSTSDIASVIEHDISV